MSAVGSVPGEHDVRRGRTGPEALGDPARLLALWLSGLGPVADPGMDFYAGWVRDALGVPVALVSMVTADSQVFPGMVGLPEPPASARCTPLTHSFCQHVVTSAEPLFVSDAREHPLLRDNPAVGELGVIAYAGLPLIDDHGNALGSLCAIDHRPREWTPGQRAELARLAVACTAEVRLRLARIAADQERERRDALERTLRRSFETSQTLLAASQAFTDTTTTRDVHATVSALADSELRPSYVGVSLLGEDGLLHRLADPRFPSGTAGREPWERYPTHSLIPSAAAVREQRLLHHPDRESYDAHYPPEARVLLRELGLHAVVAAPILGGDGPMGALVLGWREPRPKSVAELSVVHTIAHYVAAALGRARHLQQREIVAQTLQRALLTTLPDDPALPMAAIYQPADARENVGGDWYDAVRIPGAPGGAGTTWALSIGDITGHNIEAATVMGQVRSMLRQAAWDGRDRPPSEIMGAFERANAGSGLDAGGTAVLAVVRTGAPGGPASMEWVNAGHPPPIVVHPDGRTTVLGTHGILLGHGLQPRPRVDDRMELAAGSVLFLYTDGLTEHRGRPVDSEIDLLRERLAAHRDASLGDLLDRVLADVKPSGDDDVVAFAVRIPSTPA
jgi:GAF domain-containing protein